MSRTSHFKADDGTRIWYRLQGDGPTIVLCDGIGCDGYVWPYLMDAFDEDFTFVRWHYRGHGNSEEPADAQALSIEHLVADLHGVLYTLSERAGLQLPAILIGHSMGCQVIFEYAHRHPEHVRALVPICGSFGNPLDTFQQADNADAGPSAFKNLLDPLLSAVERFHEPIGAIWSRTFSSRLSWMMASRTEVNAELIKRVDFLPYLKHMGRIKVTTFLRMLRFAAHHSADAYLESLDFPTLVVAGRFDNFTPMRLSEQMAGRLPDASLVVLEEGGHTAPLEMPERLNEALLAFFEAKGLLPAPS